MRDDDDISDILAARRARSANKQLAILVLAGGGLAVVVVGVLVAALLKTRQPAGTDPAPTRVAGSPEWEQRGGIHRPAPGVAGQLDVDGMTHREMYETLVAGGLKVGFLPRGGGAYYYPAGWDASLVTANLDAGVFPERVVRADRMESAEAARQAAGRHLEGAYSRGRWFFRAHPKDRDSLPAVRRILGG